ncbi:MAG: acetoacetate--CoA ligase, partial [Solirubrobacterales bacterium]|nr:acetoacetate--CoA ligase [Solirubrobacterales bacterium]
MAVAEPKVLWTPSEERIEHATVTRYQRWLGETRGLEFEGYHDLWRWSVFDLEAFWGSLAEFLGVRFSEGGDRVLGSEVMPGAAWFPGSQLSY